MHLRPDFRRAFAAPFHFCRTAMVNMREHRLEVMVATAEPRARRQLSAAVKRLGHRATAVIDGAMAVSLCRTHRFDLVLMDTALPKLGGLVATRAILAGGGPNTGIPIVALTADDSPERRRFYQRAGLNHFMTRPIDPAQLAALLARIAGERVVAASSQGDRTQRAN